MNILITGANSGFGTLMTADLIKAGHQVVGSIREPHGRNEQAAQALEALGAKIVDIDVTDDASVETGVDKARALLGSIDVLINNAGVGSHGLQEDFSVADFQRLFDINVFGVQRMIRAVLPEMRARESGLILNISSLLGRIALPFYGPYNATKWAVEAMSENYRVELSQLGVDVAVVEPGGFPTAFIGNLMHPSSHDRSATYGPLGDAPKAALEGFAAFLQANPQQSPQLVADAVVDIVSAAPGTRRFRTEVDMVGMGDLVKPMNDQLAEASKGLFTNLGMADMLSLKVNERQAA
ncbi:MAG: SDR family oxidoreductase [Pseudomonadota bacterium]